MKINGLHLLLTYQCTLECDHCFVWSSPGATGTMTIANVRNILEQAQTVASIDNIYFEGGEPFLCYPTLVNGVRDAAAAGYSVGIVSNAFWAVDVETAREWLKPFAGLLSDFSVSSDVFHWDEEYTHLVENARLAAKQLDIPVGTISIAAPEESNAASAMGQLPAGTSRVMYRGRAAAALIDRAVKFPAAIFTTCPFENLRDPGRIHVDPRGELQICQGISIGNMFEKPLAQLLDEFNPDTHPIVSALLDGGPLELSRRFSVENEQVFYADACHLCYETRRMLREQYPEFLHPAQVYGL